MSLITKVMREVIKGVNNLCQKVKIYADYTACYFIPINKCLLSTNN